MCNRASGEKTSCEEDPGKCSDISELAGEVRTGVEWRGVGVPDGVGDLKKDVILVCLAAFCF